MKALLIYAGFLILWLLSYRASRASLASRDQPGPYPVGEGETNRLRDKTQGLGLFIHANF